VNDLIRWLNLVSNHHVLPDNTASHTSRPPTVTASSLQDDRPRHVRFAHVS